MKKKHDSSEWRVDSLRVNLDDVSPSHEFFNHLNTNTSQQLNNMHPNISIHRILPHHNTFTTRPPLYFTSDGTFTALAQHNSWKQTAPHGFVCFFIGIFDRKFSCLEFPTAQVGLLACVLVVCWRTEKPCFVAGILTFRH